MCFSFSPAPSEGQTASVDLRMGQIFSSLPRSSTSVSGTVKIKWNWKWKVVYMYVLMHAPPPGLVAMTISVSWFRIRSPLSCLPILSRSSSMLLMRTSTVGHWLACLSVYKSISLSVHVSVYLSVCVSACLPVSLSISQSVSLCSCLSASLSVYQSVSLYICLSVCLPVCLFISLSVCQSVRLCICLSVCQSVSLCSCLSASQSVRLCICLSVSQSVYVSVYLSVSQSVCLSPPHSDSSSRVPSGHSAAGCHQGKGRFQASLLHSGHSRVRATRPGGQQRQSVHLLNPYTANPFILGTSTSSLAVFNFSIFNHATCTSIIL